MKFKTVWRWAQKLDFVSGISLGHLNDPNEWVLVINKRLQIPDTSWLGFKDGPYVSSCVYSEVETLKVVPLNQNNIPEYIMTNEPLGKILIENEVVLDLKEYSNKIIEASDNRWFKMSKARWLDVLIYLKRNGLTIKNGKIDWDNIFNSFFIMY